MHIVYRIIQPITMQEYCELQDIFCGNYANNGQVNRQILQQQIIFKMNSNIDKLIKNPLQKYQHPSLFKHTDYSYCHQQKQSSDLKPSSRNQIVCSPNQYPNSQTNHVAKSESSESMLLDSESSMHNSSLLIQSQSISFKKNLQNLNASTPALKAEPVTKKLFSQDSGLQSVSLQLTSSQNQNKHSLQLSNSINTPDFIQKASINSQLPVQIIKKSSMPELDNSFNLRNLTLKRYDLQSYLNSYGNQQILSEGFNFTQTCNNARNQNRNSLVSPFEMINIPNTNCQKQSSLQSLKIQKAKSLIIANNNQLNQIQHQKQPLNFTFKNIPVKQIHIEEYLHREKNQKPKKQLQEPATLHNRQSQSQSSGDASLKQAAVQTSEQCTLGASSEIDPKYKKSASDSLIYELKLIPSIKNYKQSNSDQTHTKKPENTNISINVLGSLTSTDINIHDGNPVYNQQILQNKAKPTRIVFQKEQKSNMMKSSNPDCHLAENQNLPDVDHTILSSAEQIAKQVANFSQFNKSELTVKYAEINRVSGEQMQKQMRKQNNKLLKLIMQSSQASPISPFRKNKNKQIKVQQAQIPLTYNQQQKGLYINNKDRRNSGSSQGLKNSAGLSQQTVNSIKVFSKFSKQLTRKETMHPLNLLMNIPKALYLQLVTEQPNFVQARQLSWNDDLENSRRSTNIKPLKPQQTLHINESDYDALTIGQLSFNFSLQRPIQPEGRRNAENQQKGKFYKDSVKLVNIHLPKQQILGNINENMKIMRKFKKLAIVPDTVQYTRFSQSNSQQQTLPTFNYAQQNYKQDLKTKIQNEGQLRSKSTPNITHFQCSKLGSITNSPKSIQAKNGFLNQATSPNGGQKMKQKVLKINKSEQNKQKQQNSHNRINRNDRIRVFLRSKHTPNSHIKKSVNDEKPVSQFQHYDINPGKKTIQQPVSMQQQVLQQNPNFLSMMNISIFKKQNKQNQPQASAKQEQRFIYTQVQTQGNTYNYLDPKTIMTENNDDRKGVKMANGNRKCRASTLYNLHTEHSEDDGQPECYANYINSNSKISSSRPQYQLNNISKKKTERSEENDEDERCETFYMNTCCNLTDNSIYQPQITIKQAAYPPVTHQQPENYIHNGKQLINIQSIRNMGNHLDSVSHYVVSDQNSQLSNPKFVDQTIFQPYGTQNTNNTSSLQNISFVSLVTNKSTGMSSGSPHLSKHKHKHKLNVVSNININGNIHTNKGNTNSPISWNEINNKQHKHTISSPHHIAPGLSQLPVYGQQSQYQNTISTSINSTNTSCYLPGYSSQHNHPNMHIHHGDPNRNMGMVKQQKHLILREVQQLNPNNSTSNTIFKKAGLSRCSGNLAQNKQRSISQTKSTANKSKEKSQFQHVLSNNIPAISKQSATCMPDQQLMSYNSASLQNNLMGIIIDYAKTEQREIKTTRKNKFISINQSSPILFMPNKSVELHSNSNGRK